MRLLLATVLAWLAPLSVAAHPAQVAHARIAIEEGAVEIALSMNLFELDLVLSLDRDVDGAVSARELAARRADILEYLRGKAGVSASGRPLPMELLALGIGRSGDGRAVVETTLAFRSEHALRDIAIRCEPLTELGADHTTLARIDTREGSRQFLFRPGVTYRPAPGALAQALEFLKLGIVHIFVGYDHIAFLLGLLLAGGSTLTIVKIVTAFTAAHSVTLSLAALDVVTLSPVVVELALPASALVGSLITFNVGVEIAQVAIVALVVPALYGLTRTRLHAPLTRMASVVILSLGLFWLYQRVLV